MEEMQGWKGFVEALAQMEWKPPHQVEGGTLYEAAKPLDAVFDDYGWHESEWYAEGPPDGIERHSLLSLLWGSSAPISWDGDLEMLQVGQEAAYVFYFLEGLHETPDLLGKVVPPQTPAAYRALFLDLMRSYESFPSLPDHIYNGRPDLLDRATVRQGFWEMIEQADGGEGLGWGELRKRVGAPKPVADAGTTPSETERQALLDRYLDKCYEEANSE